MSTEEWCHPRVEDKPAIDVSLVRGYKLAKSHRCSVSGRMSVHCQQAKSNIMISFGGIGEIELLDASNEKLPKGYKGMLDVFMTRKQAEILYRHLGRRLEWEKELDEQSQEERRTFDVRVEAGEASNSDSRW